LKSQTRHLYRFRPFPPISFWYFMTYEVPVCHSLWFELQVGDQSRLMQVRLI
jgi:hypothetical protein